MLSLELLQEFWRQGDAQVPDLIEKMAADAPTMFPRFGFINDLTIAHAMAQFTVECGGGNEMTENLNYSAEGLMKNWPDRFDAAKAAAFAHQPQKIANEVYNGRLGNAPDSNDGWTYRGRGLAQTTGRDAYHDLGGLVRLDLVNKPELVNEAGNALNCGLTDFVTLCHCLPFAQSDDVIEVSQHLNGGFIGFPERTQWLATWKRAFGLNPATGTMAWVQQSLNTLGANPPLRVDAVYGDGTKAALQRFQGAHGLKTSGLPTRATIAAIKAAVPAV